MGYLEVLTATLQFPELVRPDAEPLDRSTKDIIRKLLRKDFKQRIGCSRDHPGWAAVKKHHFFRGFSFDRLLSRQLDPPFVPQHSQEPDCDSDSSGDLEFSEESDPEESDSAFSSVSSASEAEVTKNEPARKISNKCT